MVNMLKGELNMDNFKIEPDEIENLESGDIDYVGLGEITPSEIFVDLAFCIDVTQSMAPIIDTVKKLTLDLSENLIVDMCEKTNRIIKQLRVKVIAFRDYYCDGPHAMEESKFFTFPEHKTEFYHFVESLEAKGGGVGPKSALEAMGLAMRSDWVKVSDPWFERARHIVFVFTNASAHPLEKSLNDATEYYPSDMLKSYSELYYAWHPTGYPLDNSYINPYDMDMRAKRLVMFAPEDVYPWREIGEDFEYTVLFTISEIENGANLIRNLLL